MKKKLFDSMKINTNEILLNRSGKMGGHVAEVRRGTGEIVSAKYKPPKHKVDYKNEIY